MRVSRLTVQSCWCFIEPTGKHTWVPALQEVANMAVLSTPTSPFLSTTCASLTGFTLPTPPPSQPHQNTDTHTPTHTHERVHTHSHTRHKNSLPFSAAPWQTTHWACFSLSRAIASNFPNNNKKNSTVFYTLHKTLFLSSSHNNYSHITKMWYIQCNLHGLKRP